MSEEIPVFADQTVKPVVVPAVPAVPAEGGDTPAQNTGGEATPADPKAKTEEAPTPEQVAKRNQNRLDRKIDKAVRQRAEAQAKADFLERQLAEERAKNQPAKPEGKPTLEQYEFDIEKYAQALSEYTLKQSEKESAVRRQAESQRQYQERLAATWEEKVERGSEKYDDWNSVVGELKPDTPLKVALMLAKNGDDIAHYLGSNPKEARRIAQLPPLSQVREIGNLEARLAAEPAKPKLPSSAPEPIKPVGGSSSPSTKKLTEMNQDEFEKRRRAQIAARR